MRRSGAFALALCCAAALALPARAGDAKDVKLTGYITDQWCGASNANAEGKACALECAKKGAPLVLYSEGKLYKLSDQKAALQNVGVEVTVSGSLEEDGSIRVASIAQSKKKS